MKDQHLTVSVNNDALSITIGIETLCHAVRVGRPYGQEGITITNREAFIESLLCGLQSEQEDGTTPVHSMLDDVVNTMLENGEEGVELEDEDEAP